MKNFYLILIILFCALSNVFSQNLLWKKIESLDESRIQKMERSSMPKNYKLFELDIDQLKSKLSNAPLENKIKSDLIISFPNQQGTFDAYKVFEAPVMEKGLSDKFPDLKSYIGKGIDDPTATIRFSITLFGLHAMTISGNSEALFTDTFTKDLKKYIVYKKSDVDPTTNFECGFKNKISPNLDNQNQLIAPKLLTSDGTFRQFRLAMACTIEYAAFHVNAANLSSGTLLQKKNAVLSAMTVTMTRVNAIYERDLALRMNLISNNDAIIFITSDNFSNSSATALIDESQAQITSIIGSNNFDIGHTVSTGGGGYAGPSPCDNSSKAGGITGQDSPVGDPFDIDYVSHEIGHQFGANHTFNGSQGSCGGGNRNDTTAVETGSGTTIMAYAGICNSQNVQSSSDAYFHAVSISEIVDHINNFSTCSVNTFNNNAAPVVNAGANYTIPKGTKFALKGSATDANASNALTYCWEQTNVEISTQPPIVTAVGGPNFRSFSPTSSPIRYFPKLGATSTTWEVIPNVARTMTFALTVRDNVSTLGGQTGRDDMSVIVNASAGPFIVTSQNTTGISYLGNSSQVVTWNVAGTNANGINVDNVKISLSTDNGLTFPIVLSASTANDGSENVTLPNNVTSTNCKIIIESIGNIFNAINTTKFTIAPNLSNDDFEFENFVLYPNPNNGSFNISFNSNDSNDIKISIFDIQGRTIFNKIFQNSEKFNQDLKIDNIQKGIYLVTVLKGNYKSVKRVVLE